jgi:hypothetical protein
MKIPKDILIINEDDLIKYWQDAAAQASLETGIYVEVIIKFRGEQVFGPHSNIDEIVFKVMDHEFGNLTDLKRGLNIKAFL